MRYIELFESFANALPIRWEKVAHEKNNILVAIFDVEDGNFVVQFSNSRYEPDQWEISFRRNGTLDLTGTGSPHIVLSTVMASIRIFIKKHVPQAIRFSAKKSETSRVSLYPKLIAIMQREFPEYETCEQKAFGNFLQYSLERSEEN